MSTILERIIATKRGELIERKAERSQTDLETELANASLTDDTSAAADIVALNLSLIHI